MFFSASLFRCKRHNSSQIGRRWRRRRSRRKPSPWWARKYTLLHCVRAQARGSGRRPAMHAGGGKPCGKGEGCLAACGERHSVWRANWWRRQGVIGVRSASRWSLACWAQRHWRRCGCHQWSREGLFFNNLLCYINAYTDFHNKILMLYTKAIWISFLNFIDISHGYTYSIIYHWTCETLIINQNNFYFILISISKCNVFKKFP